MKTLVYKLLTPVLLLSYCSGASAANNTPATIQQWRNNPYQEYGFSPKNNAITVKTRQVAYSPNSYVIVGSPLMASAHPIGKPTLNCVVAAANTQRVPADLLLGIQSVERGQTGGSNSNSNNTYDIGAFQINSLFLPRIASMGGSEYDLSNRGCYNANVAAMLLREALQHPKKQSLDFYSRASGYHSWTPRYNQIYRNKLIKYTQEWQQWLQANGMSNLISAPRYSYN